MGTTVCRGCGPKKTKDERKKKKKKKAQARKVGVDLPVTGTKVTSQVQVLDRVSLREGPGLSVMGESAYKV